MPGDTSVFSYKNTPLVLFIPGVNTSSWLLIVQSHQPICIILAFILMGMGMLMTPFVKWTLEFVWCITGTFMRYVNVKLCIVSQMGFQIRSNIYFFSFVMLRSYLHHLSYHHMAGLCWYNPHENHYTYKTVKVGAYVIFLVEETK